MFLNTKMSWRNQFLPKLFTSSTTCYNLYNPPHLWKKKKFILVQFRNCVKKLISLVFSKIIQQLLDVARCPNPNTMNTEVVVPACVLGYFKIIAPLSQLKEETYFMYSNICGAKASKCFNTQQEPLVHVDFCIHTAFIQAIYIYIWSLIGVGRGTKKLYYNESTT